jgi:hypothetical protein
MLYGLLRFDYSLGFGEIFDLILKTDFGETDPFLVLNLDNERIV